MSTEQEESFSSDRKRPREDSDEETTGPLKRAREADDELALPAPSMELSEQLNVDSINLEAKIANPVELIQWICNIKNVIGDCELSFIDSSDFSGLKTQSYDTSNTYAVAGEFPCQMYLTRADGARLHGCVAVFVKIDLLHTGLELETSDKSNILVVITHTAGENELLFRFPNSQQRATSHVPEFRLKLIDGTPSDIELGGLEYDIVCEFNKETFRGILERFNKLGLDLRISVFEAEDLPNEPEDPNEQQVFSALMLHGRQDLCSMQHLFYSLGRKASQMTCVMQETSGVTNQTAVESMSRILQQKFKYEPLRAFLKQMPTRGEKQKTSIWLKFKEDAPLCCTFQFSNPRTWLRMFLAPLDSSE